MGSPKFYLAPQEVYDLHLLANRSTGIRDWQAGTLFDETQLTSQQCQTIPPQRFLPGIVAAASLKGAIPVSPPR